MAIQQETDRQVLGDRRLDRRATPSKSLIKGQLLAAPQQELFQRTASGVCTTYDFAATT